MSIAVKFVYILILFLASLYWHANSFKFLFLFIFRLIHGTTKSSLLATKSIFFSTFLFWICFTDLNKILSFDAKASRKTKIFFLSQLNLYVESGYQKHFVYFCVLLIQLTIFLKKTSSMEFRSRQNVSFLYTQQHVTIRYEFILFCNLVKQLTTTD